MATPPYSMLRVILTAALLLAGFMVLFLMYYKSTPAQKCHPRPAKMRPPPSRNKAPAAAKRPKVPSPMQDDNKPLLLLWFWPQNKTFDFGDCEELFNVDGCRLTADRSQYEQADGVLIYHKAIRDDLSNVPPAQRPRFQQWIWFNMDPPDRTRKIPGIQSLFNLTMTYRKDADIHVRWKLSARRDIDDDFVLPEKKRLLCRIVDDGDSAASKETRDYYAELSQHVHIDVFNNSADVFPDDESYFSAISTCKFFLAFEDSVHIDYITEKFNGPLAVGSVPVVLGPPRTNYEDFVPGSSFIHVGDFANAQELAAFLLKLDKDNKAFLRYFDWWQAFTARRHFLGPNQFAYAICKACDHLGLRRAYRVMPDVYKWFFV